MKVKIKQVDAFTSIPFGGNPAGVVTDADLLDNNIKQKIAREMNLSETAFVSRSQKADFKVQFFTPNFEVDLCGHATIATFSALYEEGKLDTSKNVFFQETRAGILPVELKKIGEETVFMMSQNKPIFENTNINKKHVSDMLNIEEDQILDLPILKVSTGIWWLVVGLKNLDALENLRPNFNLIKDTSREYNLVGITPFCLDTINPKFSYHSRAFAPLAGVNEDPVCGTGNGCIASYIIYNKLINVDKDINLIGEQGNEVNRPGSVYVNIKARDNTIQEVKVGGTAITTLEGCIIY